MTIYGYARVSTEDQNLTNQIASLTAAGASKIFSEKESGARTDREALGKALAVLQPGDTLLVTKIDRLNRSTLDLLNVIETISKKGAAFRSLGEPMIDTGSDHGELVLTLLAAVATYERKLILSRTNEGRVKAMARGVQFGRKLKLTKYQIEEARRRRSEGESHSEIARLFGVSHQTIGRL